jgi:hypothetical protein
MKASAPLNSRWLLGGRAGLKPRLVAQVETLISSRIDRRIETADQRRDFRPRPFLRDQPAQRFGQGELEEHGQHERRCTADKEHHLPAILRGEEIGDLPRGGGTEAEAEHDDGHGRGLLSGRHAFNIERPGGSEQAADGKAAEEAQHDQHFGRVRKTGDEGQHRAQHRAPQDHRAASDHVGDIGAHQRTDHLPEKGRRTDEAGHLVGQVHGVAQVRQGEGDQREVEPVEEGHHAGDQQQLDMEPGHPPALQKFGNVERARCCAACHACLSLREFVCACWRRRYFAT